MLFGCSFQRSIQNSTNRSLFHPSNSIGRTGRRDNKGVAYTFFTEEDEKQATDLVKVLQQAKQDVHPQLLSMTQKFGGNRFRQFGGWPKRKSDHFGGHGDAKRFKRFESNGSFGGPRSFPPRY